MLDVETVVDLEIVAEGASMAEAARRLLPPVDGSRPYFPPPPCWRVVCAASLAIDDQACVAKATALVGGDEAAIVRAVWRSIHEPRPVTTSTDASPPNEFTIVTWNGRHFDMPVLVARAMRHGIRTPWWYQERGARYRYSIEAHLDLLDELTDHGAADRSSLAQWSALVGGPEKLASGADVAAMFASGSNDQIARYCLGDVRALAHVHAAYMRTRGTWGPATTAQILADVDAAYDAATVTTFDVAQAVP